MLQLNNLFKSYGKELSCLVNAIRDKQNVSAFGMQFGERAIVAALLNKKCVYIVSDFVQAKRAREQLQCLMAGVEILPAKDDVLTYKRGQSGENSIIRLNTLYKLSQNKVKCLVTTVEALSQLYPSKRQVIKHSFTIKAGSSYNLDSIAAHLISVGYKRCEQISGLGQFALRGDILDIWAINYDNGIRVEFFGDDVECIKYIDMENQTSDTKLTQVDICPNTDIFLNDTEVYEVVKKLKDDNKTKSGEFYDRIIKIINDIEFRLKNGDRDLSLGFILPYMTNSVSFDDYLDANELVIYDECKQLIDNCSIFYLEHNNRFKMLLERGEALPNTINQLIDSKKVFDLMGTKLAFHKITTANRIFQPQKVCNFSGNPVTNYSKNYKGLLDDLLMWKNQKYKIVLCCGSGEVVKNMSEFLHENQVGFAATLNGDICLVDDLLECGGIFFDEKLVLIGTFEIISRSPKKIIKRNKADVFTEPQVGDYVVHNVHGVGVCEAVAKLEFNGSARDYLVIRYKDNDKLYVPIENMDSLHKFVAGDGEPTLNKIGGADFDRIKTKVKQSVKAMAINLLDLYADRKQATGHKYCKDSSLMQEFIDDFPYNETDDQLQAIAESCKDLTDGKIMDRLLCGDVGYGKTEVALRAAFKVILEGKQVALISPTTILAKQHYHTVIKRMEHFGVRVGSLTRFDSNQSIKKTLELLALNKIDIVCGTHRALSKDVIFSDLGLLILDEEQRFGVADKEKIKQLKKNVNVLTLSATPIPRTLHMSMIGIRDISVLDTPPMNRIPIQTYVTEYSDALSMDAITREVNRGGQVFVVYNRVATIDKFASTLKQLLPDIKIVVGHGQMGEGALEKVIDSFVEGEADVLVASTIIENGIDMPRANTMIVVDADNLGLAQLYQLRGRVGRSNRLAYVFFTYDGKKILSENAYKRLDAITQFTEFGSGFKIAMRDLEIRGAGNVLGREQHGHMEKVGYDMYCKLLNEAIEELNTGVTARDRKEVKVIIDYNAFIPEGYINDNEWRLRLYSRISKIKNLKDRESLLTDMRDIYGAVPDSVANLLTVGLVKNLAADIGASKVTLKKTESSITFDKAIDIPKAIMASIGIVGGVLKLDGAPTIVWNTAKGNAAMINFLLNYTNT